MAAITISKQTGCGEVLCMEIAKKLNYKFLNKEMVAYAATLGGMHPDDAALFDEYNYSSIHNLLGNHFDLSLFGFNPSKQQKKSVMTAEEYSRIAQPYEYAETPSGENFQKSMEKVIRILANDSNVIIAGRGGNFILENHPGVIHVRLIAPLEKRAENISKTMNLDNAEARKYAVDTDEKKQKYIKNYFKKDIDDPMGYHMVLNLGKFCIEEAENTIIGTLKDIDKCSK